MSDFSKIPVVDGIPHDTPVVHAAHDPHALNLRQRRPTPQSIGQLIAELLYRSSNPALAQVFILDAIEKYSDNAARLNVEEFDATDMGAIVGGDNWVAMAKEVNARVREHIDYVNGGGLGEGRSAAQLEKEITDMQQQSETQRAVDGYIQFLRERDWSKPFTEEELALKQRVDPTGEIAARFTPGQPH